MLFTLYIKYKKMLTITKLLSYDNKVIIMSNFYDILFIIVRHFLLYRKKNQISIQGVIFIILNNRPMFKGGYHRNKINEDH